MISDIILTDEFIDTYDGCFRRSTLIELSEVDRLYIEKKYKLKKSVSQLAEDKDGKRKEKKN